MKIHNFDQDRANERRKADRQATTCVYFIALLNLVAAVGYKFDAMAPTASIIWLVGFAALALAALGFKMRPEWNERRLDREMLEADSASYVDPQ